MENVKWVTVGVVDDADNDDFAGRAVCPHTAGFAGRRGNVVVRLATSTASSTGLGGESGRLGQPSLPVELSLRSCCKHFTFSIFHFTFGMFRNIIEEEGYLERAGECSAKIDGVVTWEITEETLFE